MGDDRVDWPGGRNVRVLRGSAPFGRIFRSAATQHLTDAGWAAVKASGVRTVVDLRNAPTETQRTADHPVVRPESTDGLVFVAAPTEDPEDAEFLRVCGPYLDHPRCWQPNTRLFPKRIARALRAVADGDGAVLVHCAGGRDRTGMISAMLLHIAGATPDAIIEDYAAGWRGAGAYSGHGWVYDPAGNTWQRQHHGPTDAVDLDRQVAERVPALREWIAAFDGSALLDAAGIRAVRSRVGVLAG